MATSGPLTLSATVLGWAPKGRMVTRAGARAGDLCVVCGVIGDGWLGLRAARGEIEDEGEELVARYRLPEPLFTLRQTLRTSAKAAADVSDGLLADAMHIAEASGVGLDIDLATMPLSRAGGIWLAGQADRRAALAALAAGGDDYALICAVAPSDENRFIAGVALAGSIATTIGAFRPTGGLTVLCDAAPFDVEWLGWRH